MGHQDRAWLPRTGQLRRAQDRARGPQPRHLDRAPRRQVRAAVGRGPEPRRPRGIPTVIPTVTESRSGLACYVPGLHVGTHHRGYGGRERLDLRGARVPTKTGVDVLDRYKKIT